MLFNQQPTIAKMEAGLKQRYPTKVLTGWMCTILVTNLCERGSPQEAIWRTGTTRRHVHLINVLQGCSLGQLSPLLISKPIEIPQRAREGQPSLLPLRVSRLTDRDLEPGQSYPINV